MKHTRTALFTLSLIALLSLVLSGCGPAATPTPAPTPVPSDTSVPPTTAPASSGTLTVTGLVGSELTLTEADLRAMNVATISATPPKQQTAQSYSGVRLSDLMAKAQIKAEAAALVMTGSDGYSAQIDLATLKSCADCMVAFTDTPGSFLTVMPGQTGKLWVKGVVNLEFK